MVDICPEDIHEEILIRIYNNDQQDILYNMSYRQHQLANYTSPLDRLFEGLNGRTFSNFIGFVRLLSPGL